MLVQQASSHSKSTNHSINPSAVESQLLICACDSIVRDYDKYIARQLSRGTTRQELNVSWLKKNELEIKRHVSELRDTIKNNWTNTQEFGKELRSLWNSRPNSPRLSTDMGRGLNKARDYFQHRLENGNGQSNGGATGNDFATGYSLGLMGGVRAWVSYCRATDANLTPIACLVD